MRNLRTLLTGLPRKAGLPLMAGLLLSACGEGPTEPTDHAPQPAFLTVSGSVASTCEAPRCRPGFGGQPTSTPSTPSTGEPAGVDVAGTWALGSPDPNLVFEFRAGGVAVRNDWDEGVLDRSDVFLYSVEDGVLLFGEGLSYRLQDEDSEPEGFPEFVTFEGAQFQVRALLEEDADDYTYQPSVSGDELTLGILDAETGEFGPSVTLTRIEQPATAPADLPPLTQEERIVGTWAPADGSSELIEFRADGTYIHNVEYCCPIDGIADQIVVGAWSIDIEIDDRSGRVARLTTIPETALFQLGEGVLDADRQVYVVDGDEYAVDDVEEIGGVVYGFEDEPELFPDGGGLRVVIDYMYAAESDWTRSARVVAAPESASQ
jgi:hypothetical protein